MMNMQGKSVLIVDDSAIVTRKLESLYSSMNMHIIGKAKDGLEALQMIERLRPDLVSLDIIMPVMDGIECYRQAVSKFTESKYLFISCMGGDAKFTSAFAEEIPEHLFLAKMPSAELLGQRLEKLFPNVAKKIDTDKLVSLRRSA